MPRLVFLGPAREAAGTRHDVIDADTVAAVLDEAKVRYGRAFEEIVAVSQIWVNGEVVSFDTPVGPYDEIAVLPPVSGG